MNETFWLDKWKSKDIGFHQDEINPNLIKYQSLFKENSLIYVPLCGKSKDLIYLSEIGHKVIGVELSEMAVKEFFQENDISYEINEIDGLKYFQSNKISIIVGNFFAVNNRHLKNVTAVYDRASYIALNKQQRSEYAKHLNENLPKENISYLMLTIAPVNDQCNEELGPPHLIRENEVRDNFFQNFKGELLSKINCEMTIPKYVEANITEVLNCSYHLSR